MSQAPLRVPQHDRRGDARLHVLVCNMNLSAGTPSSIDYQYTSMPTGAKKGSPDHVRTRRAPRGCRQPGEEAGGRAGRRRAAPRQSPASRPLPGAGGEGLRPPLPPAPPHLDQEIVESRWRMGNVKIERGGGPVLALRSRSRSGTTCPAGTHSAWRARPAQADREIHFASPRPAGKKKSTDHVSPQHARRGDARLDV